MVLTKLRIVNRSSGISVARQTRPHGNSALRCVAVNCLRARKQLCRLPPSFSRKHLLSMHSLIQTYFFYLFTYSVAGGGRLLNSFGGLIGFIYLLDFVHFVQQKREEDTQYFASCSYNHIHTSHRI